MTFADLFSNDAEPLRNPDQGAGTSVLERPETKESPVRDDGQISFPHSKMVELLVVLLKLSKQV